MKKYLVLQDCYGHHGFGFLKEGQIVDIDSSENINKKIFQEIKNKEDEKIKDKNNSYIKDYAKPVGHDCVERATMKNKEFVPEKKDVVQDVTVKKTKSKNARK